jgi:hypothetical protein
MTESDTGLPVRVQDAGCSRPHNGVFGCTVDFTVGEVKHHEALGFMKTGQEWALVPLLAGS